MAGRGGAGGLIFCTTRVDERDRHSHSRLGVFFFSILCLAYIAQYDTTNQYTRFWRPTCRRVLRFCLLAVAVDVIFCFWVGWHATSRVVDNVHEYTIAKVGVVVDAVIYQYIILLDRD